MPLSPTTLASEIVSQFNSKFGAPVDPAELQKFAEAVAAAVVTRLVADAVVNVTVTGTATVAAFGTPGPVAGTGTGTLT
jgi:hypothetical protein